MESKIKHLELIQAIISRMANNSFLLKGWAITLFVAIFALAWDQESVWHFCLTYIPILSFWFLDAYYLQQERLYRQLYDEVRLLDSESIDFSMKPPSSKVKDYFKVLFSGTELLYYAPILVIISIVVVSILF